MWVYTSGRLSTQPIVCFQYRDNRSGKSAADFLNGFKGVLVTDGYAAYNKVPYVVHAGCRAHMRRYWTNARVDGATSQNAKAPVGVEYCDRLFAMERSWQELPPEERRLRRQQEARPLVDAYFDWVLTIHCGKGKTNLAKAVTCAKNQRTDLCTFLEHGEIEISNNHAENAIRPFVIGRKGWLFSDTTKGAESSAIAYSVVETAKANQLRVEDYLQYLFTVLPGRVARATDREPLAVADLLPWSDEIQKKCSMGSGGH